MDRKENPTSQNAKSDRKNFREKRGAAKSTVHTPHALIGHCLPSLIQDLNLEMQDSPVRHIVRNERYELLDYLLHIAEANVLHFAQCVALEIDSAFDHVLFGETEKFCVLLLLLTSLSLTY